MIPSTPEEKAALCERSGHPLTSFVKATNTITPDTMTGTVTWTCLCGKVTKEEPIE